MEIIKTEHEQPLQERKPSLLGMIWKPSEQFAAIRHKPVFWLPILVLMVLFTISAIMQMNGMDIASQMSKEELALMDEEELAMLNSIAMITGIISGPFIPLIAVLISAAVYLVAAKIAKKEVTFKQLLSMSTFILFISAIGSLLNGILALTIGNGNYLYPYTSIAGMLGTDNAVLGTIELFSIWGTVLTAIGLQITGRFPKALAWGISIGFFLIGLLFAFAGMAFESMMDL